MGRGNESNVVKTVRRTDATPAQIAGTDPNTILANAPLPTNVVDTARGGLIRTGPVVPAGPAPPTALETINADIASVQADIASLTAQQVAALEQGRLAAIPPADRSFGVPLPEAPDPFVAPDTSGLAPVPFDPTTITLPQPTRTGPAAAFAVPMVSSIQEGRVATSPRGTTRGQLNTVARPQNSSGPIQNVLDSRQRSQLRSQGKF